MESSKEVFVDKVGGRGLRAPHGVFWSFTLFGTAVGAGILYLPIQAGLAGIWVLVVVSILAFPVTYLSHKVFGNMLFSSEKPTDYSGVLDNNFDGRISALINVVFFITFFIILTAYSIGLNSNLGEYLIQLDLTKGNLAESPFLSLGILLILFILMKYGGKIVLKVMSVISSILIILLFSISVYLIRYWNLSAFQHFSGVVGFSHNFLLVLPVIAFSFMFFPAMPVMSISYRLFYKDDSVAERKMKQVTFYTTVLLLVFTLFFVFSCVLAMHKTDFYVAMHRNLNCLTILSSNHKGSLFLVNLGTLIGLTALITSFVGVFFCVRESAHGIVNEFLDIITDKFGFKIKHKINIVRRDNYIMLILLLALWLITILNFKVINLLGQFITPLVSIFIFILPVIILWKVPKAQKYKKIVYLFVFLTGVFLIFSFSTGKFLNLL